MERDGGDTWAYDITTLSYVEHAFVGFHKTVTYKPPKVIRVLSKLIRFFGLKSYSGRYVIDSLMSYYLTSCPRIACVNRLIGII